MLIALTRCWGTHIIMVIVIIGSHDNKQDSATVNGCVIIAAQVMLVAANIG